MAKRGKRAKRRAAKLKKKLGFFPAPLQGKPRFGSIQERVAISGKANRLGKTLRATQQQLDRRQKQAGWD